MVDATQVVKFGGGTQEYVFPTYSQADFRTNFKNAVPRTVRMPGMDGGVDLFGVRPAPKEIGQVNFSFTIAVEDRADMTAARDTLAAMDNWGRRKLWVQPSDSTSRRRWCFARLNNVSDPQNFDKHTDIWQRVTCNFQVADPRWLALPAGEWYLDDGYLLDDGEVLNDPRVEVATVNDGSTVTLNNGGNCPTPVMLIFKTGSETVTNLAVRVYDDSGNVLNGFLIEKTLSTNLTYIVDSHPKPRVLDDYVSDYANFTRLGGTGFIVLQPGDTILTISGTFSDDITLEAYYEDAWRSI